jgi:hypothetical protein
MLSVDDGGELDLVWTDDRTGTKHVWYREYDAGQWSLDHRVSGSPVDAALPCICKGADGALDVVWRDARDGNYELYGRALRFGASDLAEGMLPARRLAVRCVPNPCRGSTWFELQLPTAARVELRIYDVTGRRVRNLVDRILPPGYQKIPWNGASEQGGFLSTGVYFYRLASGSETRVGRVVLSR